jgi:hypothetical protein
VDGCLACDLSEGRRPLPGVRLGETPGWIVEHGVGPLGIGTLIVKPKLFAEKARALLTE